MELIERDNGRNCNLFSYMECKILVSYYKNSHLYYISLCLPAYSTFDNNFDFKIRREYQKVSCERRVCESVDVESLFWVISHKSTDSSTHERKDILIGVTQH